MQTVDARTLCRAPERFAGQRLRVRGKVYFAGENIRGEPMLVFPPSGDGGVLISACFRRDEKTALQRFDSGATLVIEGLCAPRLSGPIVQLRDCTVGEEAAVVADAEREVERLMHAVLRYS